MPGSPMEEKYLQAAQVICRQGIIPLPVNETSIEIVRMVVEDSEAELDFILAFSEKASQTTEQLQASSGLSAESIEGLGASLAKKGLLFNQPNSAGVMVYRLLPLVMIGLMEYLFMGELKGDEKERRYAVLFEKLMDDLRDGTQENYDAMVPLFQMAPPVDRTVPARIGEDGKKIRLIPVETSIGIPEEFVLPSQSVTEIIEKFDEIAVGRCFCRQRRSLLGEPCTTDAPVRNCFTFGKSARHTAAQGFAEMVSREEALAIMKEAEAAGLVHKAFHPNSREDRPETSICNCCKDCCDTLRLWRGGTLPLVNSTYYLSVVDPEACTGCGTCEERCPTEAVAVNADGVAVVDADACFGCGVCARFCPEEAIALQEGLRKVFILPPDLRAAAK